MSSGRGCPMNGLGGSIACAGASDRQPTAILPANGFAPLVTILPRDETIRGKRAQVSGDL